MNTYIHIHICIGEYHGQDAARECGAVRGCCHQAPAAAHPNRLNDK